MAGYLITLDDVQSLKQIVESGVYSTVMKPPKFATWGTSHEGTFADYLSMKEGDRVFFFVDRRIYGCGKLKNVGNDCKFFNYVDANLPHGHNTTTFNQTKIIQNSSRDNRCFCVFEPSPAFFVNGIDMDQVLISKDNPFRSLRTMWKVSFIKMDDDESLALYNIIIKFNENNLTNKTFHLAYKTQFYNRLKRLNLFKYTLDRHFLIEQCTNSKTNQLRHEMALEASLCEILSFETRNPFGRWDYISHQVAASPFKPVDYMDKMDVFGYRFVTGYEIKSKYIIAELKRDVATTAVVEQIMKYVDWVSNEYANKDYSMIDAYIVAADFTDEVKMMAKKHGVRNYTKGYRPTQFCVWDSLKMIKYEVQSNDVVFSAIN